MKIIEPNALHNIYDDVIRGADVKYYKKQFSEVENLYKNGKGIEATTTVYTVYSYEQGAADQIGNLYWGLTILEPIYINQECNMTRGHFHQDKNCAEFYFGIAGDGLLLLMDEQGTTWAEKVFQGSLHHIDGKFAHRLVNTGDTQLKVGACWPTTAGHDYEAIETCEFGYRILKNDQEIIFEKR